ncbi:MAG: DEAD/DEAH box helicase [Candidatus Thorarchaeota archaeon]
MKFSLVIKDKNKAYLGTLLWLPKKFINSIRIKTALEFEVYGKDGQNFLQLWEETPNHIGVPREFIPPEEYKNLSFPIINLSPSSFPRVNFKSKVVLDKLDPSKDIQKRAFAAFCKAKNGLLNLSCGNGKTTIALHAIARMGLNTLIIVNQKTILSQWEGAIRNFLEFKGSIGLIQGKIWDWKHPITIAMLHSLARHPDKVSIEIRRWFGVVIWDEIHHLSAPYFCVTATMFPGRRYGLTATAKREDGTEVVYNYHVGDVFYKDLYQEVKPTIIFRQTQFLISPEDFIEFVLDISGQPNMGKLRTYMGSLEERNEFIAIGLRDALSSGRKILALSHSKIQLKKMYEKLSKEGIDTGICTGDEKVVERWAALRDKRLIFGTHQLVMEAIDEDSLDTLFWLTPFGSQHPDGGKNALQQGMGRIQGYRFKEGMKQPMVVIYDDIYVKYFHRMCNVLRKQLRSWPVDEGGPYKYTDLPPY